MIPVYVKPGHHPNMGVLEPEKLQWMSSAGVGGSGKPPPTDNQVRLIKDVVKSETSIV